MIFSLYSWLQGDDSLEILRNPPKEFLALAMDKNEDKYSAPSTQPRRAFESPPQIARSPAPSRRSGPVPRYAELRRGVGVAITLKEDQGTSRTVDGFVLEVLTAGDHPHGVKVRMSDGRVGRVQFLTGKTERRRHLLNQLELSRIA
ncbi:hypothetical protein BC829DRAFT_275916 [Chytridium lagenaria]|nr:hypothetical protein BC829DRAFT_275916 [Chytridium lagenaria]